jgi:general L-amino acid transport system substrate-binding protein
MGGERLDAIRARGHLTCGVGADSPGFSHRDSKGVWRGFDIDLSPDKVTFEPIDTLPHFLEDKEIDVVLRGLTWTYGRETGSELRFGPIVMYDGETFLVKKSAGITAIPQLSGKTICVSQDAEFLGNLRYYFRSHDLTLKAVVTEKRSDSADAFFAGRCDAMTADASELVEAVIGKSPNPDGYTILPQQITKEPLAPLLRKGDDEFFDAVRWTIFALIDAEELGIDSKNVKARLASDDPDVKLFFKRQLPTRAGFDASWQERAVSGVGNYGEIFERNLGSGSPAKLGRGLNRLWTAGGILYAPPVR